MRRLLFQLPMLLLGLISTEQVKKAAINAKNIAINWQIIENDYAGGGQFLSSLNVQNNDPLALSNKNWKLYFNFARRIVPGTTTGNVEIVHVNGDLYYIRPTDKFKPIQNGTSAHY